MLSLPEAQTQPNQTHRGCLPHSAPCPQPPCLCTKGTQLPPSSGGCSTQGLLPTLKQDLSFGPHSASVLKARALLSRTDVSPPDLRPCCQLVAKSGFCFLKHSLCCDTFWEPLKLSNESNLLCFPQKMYFNFKWKMKVYQKMPDKWVCSSCLCKIYPFPQTGRHLNST